MRGKIFISFCSLIFEKCSCFTLSHNFCFSISISKLSNLKYTGVLPQAQRCNRLYTTTKTEFINMHASSCLYRHELNSYLFKADKWGWVSYDLEFHIVPFVHIHVHVWYNNLSTISNDAVYRFFCGYWRMQHENRPLKSQHSAVWMVGKFAIMACFDWSTNNLVIISQSIIKCDFLYP